MKKKSLIFISSIMLCLLILTSNAYANEVIPPVNEVYKSGIYELDKNDTGSYNVMYEFVDKDKKAAIIVLDSEFNITYKNINCNRRCNAGTITNKDTIVIVGDDEAALFFTKVN